MGLREVVIEAESVAASLDPEVVAPGDAVTMLEQAARLRNIASALCTMLAPRATASGMWRRDGARTEAEWLARKLGTSEGEARSTIDTGRALAILPTTDAALRSGALSPAQAAAITDAATADPASEPMMLRRAERDHLAGLRKERDRVKAAADPDADARYRRIHRDRYLRTWTDTDGAGRGAWSTTPDRQAVILAAIEEASRDVARRAHARDERAASEAYAVDALASLVAGTTSASGRRLPPKAIVRIDHAALVRGDTAPGETSEIAGVGPVPVALVRELMDAGDMFLTAVVTKGVDVVGVAHLGRKPTAFQTTALEWRDTTCRVECCKRPPTEWDHHEDWAATRRTALPHLGGLCDHHHDLKTYRGYRIVDGVLPGKIRLVPD